MILKWNDFMIISTWFSYTFPDGFFILIIDPTHIINNLLILINSSIDKQILT